MEHFWNTPSCEAPLVYERSMMNSGPFCILVWGCLLVYRCHPATRQMVKILRLGIEFPSNLPISLSPTSVTFSSDCCYHQRFNPKPSYFHHLAGGRVVAIHKEASPNENAKRTTIHHRSLVHKRRLARGSVPQMLQYIYAPPQNRPISGGAKQILPLIGDAAAFGHVCLHQGQWLFFTVTTVDD